MSSGDGYAQTHLPTFEPTMCSNRRSKSCESIEFKSGVGKNRVIVAVGGERRGRSGREERKRNEKEWDKRARSHALGDLTIT